MFELCHLTRIHVVRLSRILVVDGCRALIGIDGISGEIKYDPKLSMIRAG